MFDRGNFLTVAAEVSGRLHRLACYPGIHFSVYPQYAFSPPDGEQYIRISRAPKEIGDSGMDFWLCAEWLGDWRGRETYFLDYLASAAFEAISEREFNDLVIAQCTGLIVRPELPLNTSAKFVGAIVLYSMKTEFIVSAVAEYEDEFIHFYWDTAA